MNSTVSKATPFEKLAEAYSQNKTDRNFEALYKAIRRIARSAQSGLTVQQEDYETIVDDVSLKLHANFDKYYQENKSLLSFIFLACKRKYFSLKKGYDKRIYESDLQYRGGGDDKDFNYFEVLVANNQEVLMPPIEIEHTTNDTPFHKDPKQMVARIGDICKEITKGSENPQREYKILLDTLTLRNNQFTFNDDRGRAELEVCLDAHLGNDENKKEVGSVSGFISPEVVAKKYGITNRTTISAKRNRAIKKIKTTLEADIENSKALNGPEKTGKKTIIIPISEYGIEKVYKVEFGVVDGVPHGEFEKKILKNGAECVVQSGRLDNGKKAGVWSFNSEKTGAKKGTLDYVKGKVEVVGLSKVERLDLTEESEKMFLETIR